MTKTAVILMKKGWLLKLKAYPHFVFCYFKRIDLSKDVNHAVEKIPPPRSNSAY